MKACFITVTGPSGVLWINPRHITMLEKRFLDGQEAGRIYLVGDTNTSDNFIDVSETVKEILTAIEDEEIGFGGETEITK